MSCIRPFLLRNPLYSKRVKINAKYRLQPYIPVPCGNCLLCHITKQQWLIDCGQYELKKHGYATFLTLTYDDKHLHFVGQKDGSMLATLDYSDIRNFISDIKRKLGVKKISYIYCGEYGQNPIDGVIPRPHYHIALFGVDYLSFGRKLQELWYHGLCDVKPVENGCVRYIVKYLDKHIGDKTDYGVLGLQKPRSRHSNGFGFGLVYDNIDDVRRNNYTYLSRNNKRLPIPSYLVRKLFGKALPSFNSIRYTMRNDYKLLPKNGVYFTLPEIVEFRKKKNKLIYNELCAKMIDNRNPVEFISDKEIRYL